MARADPERAGGSGLKDPITKAVVDVGRRHTFYENVRGERFNLVALQRMNLHYLRKRLLDEAATIFTAGEMKDENSETLTRLMQNYCTAVKDREFMRDWALRDWDGDPFFLKSGNEMERDLLNDLKAKGIRPCQMLANEDSRTLPQLPGGPWDFPSAEKVRKERYAVAVLGSAIITGPMVLMTLVRSTTASLITVAVCTTIFAVTIAYFFPTKLPVELLGATAAYTAVLVVFVGGTSGSGPT